MEYTFLRFPGGKAKAVTLSYDDGSRYDIRFSETITRHGLKATFNINSNRLGKNSTDYNLTKEEITEYIIKKGHEIAIHGANHNANGLQRTVAGIQEVLNCRLNLEKNFGGIIRGMAYPDSGITCFQNGISYENIKRYLTDLDIVYARSLGSDNNRFELPNDWHSWTPSAHHNNPKLFDYIDTFLNFDHQSAYRSLRTPKLLYIWGHSSEFEDNQNWDRLEKICKLIGSKEDIWYATNIEIYNYVTAYNSLVFSADGSVVYNPTVRTVWFDIGGTLYNIKSDETLKIGD